jgi:myo-inositol-1-phosphate synthase
LLFPILGGYSVRDIEVVAAFDISGRKVGRPIAEAIYQEPNNFVRIPGGHVISPVIVHRGPTLDGNPPHLAVFVPESDDPELDVAAALKESQAEVLVNLLPTGSIQATKAYARAALAAGCAFINCIPTILAQTPEVAEAFASHGLPILGDDIKSQLGTTILHRTLLQMLQMRGAHLEKTSQVIIGGNTDFVNFVYRAETKLVSKRKSLAEYTNGTPMHIGHHYDVTKGPLKNAFIEIEASVFGGSPVKISVKLESDDKPNSAGSVVDLIRLASALIRLGIAAGFLALSGLLDALDGELARQREREYPAKPPNRLGPFIDSVADHYGDFAVYFGLAWWAARSAHGQACLASTQRTSDYSPVQSATSF